MPPKNPVCELTSNPSPPTSALMDHMPGPRWKKGKDGKDFAAVATANPMSGIMAELQASLREPKPVAILSGRGGAVLQVTPMQAVLLNRAAFGRAMENTGTNKQWFELGPEETFYLCHDLKCVSVESESKKKQMSERELWDHMRSMYECFPELYKAYLHLRSKNWVVRSGLQYGADFMAYRHHPALVHSEFAVVVVPEGEEFDSSCGRLRVWSDVMCALRASGSVAKTLLVLTIGTNRTGLSSLDCLEQLLVHERTIRRWIPQQCREERCELDREEVDRGAQEHKSGSVVFDYWGVILGFTVLSSLLVYKLKF